MEPNDADVRLAKDLFLFFRERELRAIADYRSEIESRVRAECAKPEQGESVAKLRRWHHAAEGDYCTGLVLDPEGEVILYSDLLAALAQSDKGAT